MRIFFTICSLIAASCYVDALSVANRSLEEVIRYSDLIVIGHIESYAGREKSEIEGPKYRWDADLIVTEILKGPQQSNEKGREKGIRISWLEFHSSKEYESNSSRIWILEKTEEGGHYTVSIPYGTHLLSHKEKILKHVTSRSNHRLERSANTDEY